MQKLSPSRKTTIMNWARFEIQCKTMIFLNNKPTVGTVVEVDLRLTQITKNILSNATLEQNFQKWG